MINGRSLIGLTHQEAVDVLRNSPRLVQLVVAAKVIRALRIAYCENITAEHSSEMPQNIHL